MAGSLLFLLPLLGVAQTAEPRAVAAEPTDFTAAVLFQAASAQPPEAELAVYGDLPSGEAGWLIGVQPSGAWSFRLSDGVSSLSYLPTAPRQQVLDGRPHLVQLAADLRKRQLRLYFDGRQVAVYEAAGFEKAFGRAPRNWERAEAAECFHEARLWDDRELARYAEQRGFARPAPPQLEAGDSFRVMSWNIWHGGREDGEEIGPQRVVECIRAAGADIVCMQETYGSGAIIADALGYELYLRSSNLSILSRFPIGETHRLFEPFRFGGARIRLAPDRELDAFVLWIHYLPDYWDLMMQEHPPDPAAMVAAEWDTRGLEITSILKTLKPLIDDGDGVPLLVAGDFNSGSHLDWTDAAKSAHRGLVVEFPVSKAMADAGFTDAFRAAHPDPLADPGHTWSPRFAEAWQDRIDYIYFQGALDFRGAEHLDSHPARWPSDHGAMVAEFELPGREGGS